jgi:hypothetical protein
MKLKSNIERKIKYIWNKCSIIINNDFKVAKGMNDLAMVQAASLYWIVIEINKNYTMLIDNLTLTDHKGV